MNAFKSNYILTYIIDKNFKLKIYYMKNIFTGADLTWIEVGIEVGANDYGFGANDMLNCTLYRSKKILRS
jgi:hypothetical protein